MSALYDEVTGQPTVEALDEAQAAEEKRQIEEASQFEALLQNAAYRKLETWLADQIENCKEQLIDAKPEDVLRLQQSARAYSNVVGWVREQVEFGKSLKEAVQAREQRARETETA